MNTIRAIAVPLVVLLVLETIAADGLVSSARAAAPAASHFHIQGQADGSMRRECHLVLHGRVRATPPAVSGRHWPADGRDGGRERQHFPPRLLARPGAARRDKPLHCPAPGLVRVGTTIRLCCSFSLSHEIEAGGCFVSSSRRRRQGNRKRWDYWIQGDECFRTVFQRISRRAARMGDFEIDSPDRVARRLRRSEQRTWVARIQTPAGCRSIGTSFPNRERRHRR